MCLWFFNFFRFNIKYCLCMSSFNCHNVRANTLVFNPASTLKLSFLCSIFPPWRNFRHLVLSKVEAINSFDPQHTKNGGGKKVSNFLSLLLDKLMSLVRFCHVCLLLCFVLACHMNSLSLLRTSDFRQIHHLPFLTLAPITTTVWQDQLWIVIYKITFHQYNCYSLKICKFGMFMLFLTCNWK